MIVHVGPFKVALCTTHAAVAHGSAIVLHKFFG
jgi:hypothetical protein